MGLPGIWADPQHHLHTPGAGEGGASKQKDTCQETHASQPMDNCGGLPSSAAHPPTHPPTTANTPPLGGPGGAPAFFPKSGGTRENHPPTLRPTDPAVK